MQNRVIIVGRPNVGKSTLFNRLVGARLAVVEERAKVTRDAKESETRWRGRTFTIVDTGGWLANDDVLDRKVSAMVERAIETAGVVLLVGDVRTGVTEEDLAVAAMLRRSPAPVRVVVNKVDDGVHEPGIWEFVSLGFGDPIAISAMHGRATGDLLDLIGDLTGGFEPPQEVEVRESPEPLEPLEDLMGAEHQLVDPGTDDLPPPSRERSGTRVQGMLRVAIVGRPNVGKSTLFNRIVGHERSVVYDLPGTTIDTIDTVVETPDGVVRFFDTAGLRRQSKYGVATEYYSMVRTLQAIDAADISILVIDATVGVTGWDQRLAERIDTAGSPILVVVNKWDLTDHEQRLSIGIDLRDRLGFLSSVMPLRISALSGKGVHRIFSELVKTEEAYSSRIPTAALNRFIKTVQAKNPPRGGRILYAVQGATEPPTLTLFTNHPLERGYLRYLDNQLRAEFNLGPTPVKLRVRRRD
ncbi:MAG: ribosome biogenesis GTPase Der [Ferrimicrobium sp.]